MSAGGGALGIVAGIDPTGGAGLVRDVWTHAVLAPQRPLRCQPSAWTWQGQPGGARAQAVERERFVEGLRRFDDVTSLKIGLLPASLVAPMSKWIERRRAQLATTGLRLRVVFDPVLSASEGGDMGASAAGAWELAACCDLVTPNRWEFEALVASARGSGSRASTRETETSMTGPAIAELRGDARIGAREVDALSGWWADLRSTDAPERASSPRTPRWLVKSAIVNEQAIGDLLLDHDGLVGSWIRTPSSGPDPRGTGCALATAIATMWTDELELAQACARASNWLAQRRAWVHPGPDGRAHLSR